MRSKVINGSEVLALMLLHKWVLLTLHLHMLHLFKGHLGHIATILLLAVEILLLYVQVHTAKFVGLVLHRLIIVHFIKISNK